MKSQKTRNDYLKKKKLVFFIMLINIFKIVVCGINMSHYYFFPLFFFILV